MAYVSPCAAPIAAYTLRDGQQLNGITATLVIPSSHFWKLSPAQPWSTVQTTPSELLVLSTNTTLPTCTECMNLEVAVLRLALRQILEP
jgi:hypothetical protein